MVYKEFHAAGNFGSSKFLVGISTTECSEAPSVTRKVAMEKTSAKYQPPQMPSGSVPNFGERGTCASRVSQILLILLIMCLKKLSRRFCFRHIIYKKNGERPQRRYGFLARKAMFFAVILCRRQMPSGLSPILGNGEPALAVYLKSC